MKYPPTPLAAEALRCASAQASEGYPPVAESAEASLLRHVIDSGEAYAFIHPGKSRGGLLRRRIKKGLVVPAPDPFNPAGDKTPINREPFYAMCARR